MQTADALSVTAKMPVQRDEVLGIIILDGHQRTCLPLHCLRPLQQVGRLNVDPLPLPRGDEVHLRRSQLAHRNKVPATLEIEEYEILQKRADIALPEPQDGMP